MSVSQEPLQSIGETRQMIIYFMDLQRFKRTRRLLYYSLFVDRVH